LEELTNESKLLLYIARNVLNNKRSILDKEIISDLNWITLFEQSMRHKVFLLVYSFIKEYIPEKYNKLFSDNYELQILKIKSLINEISNVSDIMKRSDIEILIMKGVIYSHIIYDDLFARECDDIDILVNENDMYKIDALLRKNGYFQAYKYDMESDEVKLLPFPLLMMQNHHEFFPYAKRMEDPVKFIKLEVARYLHTIKDENIGTFIKSSQEIELGNFFVSTFDIPHTLISICENAYENAHDIFKEKTLCLRDYIDIFAFIKKYNSLIDWVQIFELANKYGVAYQLNYIFSNLNIIYDGCISNDIIKLFNATPNGKYDNGSELNWDINIIERLFCCRNWRKDTNVLIKKKSFSQRNINYNNPFKAKKYTDFNLEDPDRYKVFHDSKYCFEIKHCVYFDNSGLYFVFSLDERLSIYLENFLITLRLVDSNIESPILSREVRITKSHGKVTIFDSFENSIDLFDNSDIAELKELSKSTDTDINPRSIFQIKFSYSDLQLDLSHAPIKLCYNISLHERIFDELIYPIGEMYEIWNPGTIEIPIDEVRVRTYQNLRN